MTAVAEDTRGISTEAAEAVRQLELRADAPDELELLESSWKSAVLRATWRHPRPWRAVLKRCDPGTAATEVTVHADVLPRIGVRAPRLFGVWAREGSPTWLAFEDMGDEAPRLDDDRQRALVSRWLGELHGGSRHLPDVPRLPDRGAQHYAGLLELARARLIARQAEEADDEGRLREAVRLCDSLRSSWHAVEEQAALLAPVVVHADLAPENLRVVRSATGVDVTAIDWEKAGIGTPFVDLAMAEPRAYAGAAGVAREAVSSSMWVARLLAALSHNWAVKPMPEVERYARRIERALGAIRER